MNEAQMAYLIQLIVLVTKDSQLLKCEYLPLFPFCCYFPQQ